MAEEPLVPPPMLLPLLLDRGDVLFMMRVLPLLDGGTTTLGATAAPRRDAVPGNLAFPPPLLLLSSLLLLLLLLLAMLLLLAVLVAGGDAGWLLLPMLVLFIIVVS